MLYATKPQSITAGAIFLGPGPKQKLACPTISCAIARPTRMASRRRIRPKTWVEVQRSLRPGVATIDASYVKMRLLKVLRVTSCRHSFCQEIGEEELASIAKAVPTCKRMKMPGAGIGQIALEATLLPALLASSTLMDVQLPGCLLTHIPAELFTIKNISSLNLSHNQLAGGIPSSFWHARSLRRLELQAGEGPDDATPSTPAPPFPGAQQEHDLGSFPPTLPSGVATPPRLALRHVNIAGCGVTALRPSISALRDLQVLMAGRNPVHQLPQELAQCTGLAVLDVLGCPLAEVPPALASRRGLELKTGLPDAILPWLYLGDATAAANQRGLHARGISRVLSLVQPAECLLHAGVDCLNIAVDDTPIARLGFASCPVPYFLRFALCPADEVPTPTALGLSHGSVGGLDALVEADSLQAPEWLPPHLAPHAGVSFGERGLPPLHLHAHRRDALPGTPLSPLSPPPNPPDAQQPAPLLVHCHAGASRSATATVAILMAMLQWPLARAFKHVKARRGVVQPNIGFCDQLLHFERTLLEAGILELSAPEFGPPPAIGAVKPETWPNSISMKQLVQQSAGSMSASVWNARYSTPAATPKRHVDPGLKLRALVKTVAAATRFNALRLHASGSQPYGATASATPAEPVPPAASGFHTSVQHDPRTLSATHASVENSAPRAAAGAGRTVAPGTHRSWSVSTKWLSDKDAQRQGAVSPLPGGAAQAASTGDESLLTTIHDRDETDSSPPRSPKRRPAGLAKRPSIDLSDWEEGKRTDAEQQQSSGAWSGEDDEAVQAVQNRMRYAPNSARAPPCFSALPHWAWRRLADVFPGQRRASMHNEGHSYRLEDHGESSALASPFPGGVSTPFPELVASSAHAGAAVGAGTRAPSTRPMVAAASAVSLADLPASMRKHARESDSQPLVPQVLGLLAPPPIVLGGERHARFRLQSHSDHGTHSAPYIEPGLVVGEKSHGAGASPEAVTPTRAHGNSEHIPAVNSGALSPFDEGAKHHVLRRHSFGV